MATSTLDMQLSGPSDKQLHFLFVCCTFLLEFKLHDGRDF